MKMLLTHKRQDSCLTTQKTWTIQIIHILRCWSYLLHKNDLNVHDIRERPLIHSLMQYSSRTNFQNKRINSKR